MVDLVLQAVGRPLMQLNIPEHFANPTMDKRPKMREQEWKEKLEKFILPQSDHPAVEQTPRFGPTHLLAAAIWLHFKKKFLNEGTAKDACRKFTVKEKQLSKILNGSRYKGGKKQKLVPAEKPDDEDEEDDPQPPAPKKSRDDRDEPCK